MPKLAALPMSGIAQQLGVPLRTMRRRCEVGEVPGAYQTRGGHWRIREAVATKFMCAELNRRVDVNEWLRKHNEECAPIVFTLFMADISRDDYRASIERPDWLKKHHPRKWDLLCNTSRDFQEKIHPRATEAVKLPTTGLFMIAELLRRNGVCEVVTSRLLARAMRMSRAKLYRKFRAENVRTACQGALHTFLIPTYRKNRTVRRQQNGN